MSLRCIIAGGGAAGLSSALRLAQSGVSVTLLDRNLEPGLECSYSNAAVLCPAHSRPKSLSASNILKWSIQDDLPVHMQWRKLAGDPQFWRFAIQALRRWPTSTKAIQESGTRMYNIARAGMDQIAENCRSVAELKEYRTLERGLFSLHTNKDEMIQEFELLGEVLKPVGYRMSILTKDECLEREPKLANLHEQGRISIVGAVFQEMEHIADPYPFSDGLHKACERLGVQFKLGVSAQALQTNASGNQVTGVITDRGVVEGDIFVVCLGAHSPALVRTASTSLPCPIYPLRGHALTLDTPKDAVRFSRPICFQGRQIFTTPLQNGKQRVTGFGDFSGYDVGPHGVQPSRLRQLVKASRNVFPEMFPEDDAKLEELLNLPRQTHAGYEPGDPLRAWTGLRPQSADNIPICGSYQNMSNLYVNSGGGVMGWTASNGAANLLRDLITGQEPSLNPKHYSPNRFA